LNPVDNVGEMLSTTIRGLCADWQLRRCNIANQIVKCHTIFFHGSMTSKIPSVKGPGKHRISQSCPELDRSSYLVLTACAQYRPRKARSEMWFSTIDISAPTNKTITPFESNPDAHSRQNRHFSEQYFRRLPAELSDATTTPGFGYYDRSGGEHKHNPIISYLRLWLNVDRYSANPVESPR